MSLSSIRRIGPFSPARKCTSEAAWQSERSFCVPGSQHWSDLNVSCCQGAARLELLSIEKHVPPWKHRPHLGWGLGFPPAGRIMQEPPAHPYGFLLFCFLGWHIVPFWICLYLAFKLGCVLWVTVSLRVDLYLFLFWDFVVFMFPLAVLYFQAIRISCPQYDLQKHKYTEMLSLILDDDNHLFEDL